MTHTYIKEHEVVEDDEIKKLTVEMGATKRSTEPPFIKLYISNLLHNIGLKSSLTPLMFELVSNMTFIKPGDPSEGNIVQTTKYWKDQVAKKLNKKPGTVSNELAQLTKAGIIQNIATSVYRVNPKYFATGDWRDIERVRLIFDYTDKGMTMSSEATFGTDVYEYESKEETTEINDEKTIDNQDA